MMRPRAEFFGTFCRTESTDYNNKITAKSLEAIYK